ncbi:PelD GGDEF domain-containing protein [Sulfurimonas sp.]
MNFAKKRIKKISRLDIFLNKVKKYAYIETISIVGVFLLVGYFISPQDICFVDKQISYLLILLAIITLFHGFENGLVAIGMISLAMWSFYPEFPYIDFLVALMMTMIFSEFHYYWTRKIKELTVEANYKTTKLNELSKAFYTLKISHDQLEKNYVVKPMSIRNAIESIIATAKELQTDSTNERTNMFYKNFLSLLEKSFNVNSGFIIYKNNTEHDLIKENSSITYSSICEKYTKDEIMSSYLVDRAIEFKQPIYISDSVGEPALKNKENSKFLVAIPFVWEKNVNSVLVIDSMPFMAFNKENLISISILLEYLSITIAKNKTLAHSHKISQVNDEDFIYEYNRLRYISDNYQVDSTIMVIKIDNELQTRKVHEKIKQMLRSLDIATVVKYEKNSFIILLFPLSDESSALGFLNRLKHNIKDFKDKQFQNMNFSVQELTLLNKYIEDDYHD